MNKKNIYAKSNEISKRNFYNLSVKKITHEIKSIFSLKCYMKDLLYLF